MRRRIKGGLLLVAVLGAALAGATEKSSGWRLDFGDEQIGKMPQNWQFQAGKMFVPKTRFIVREDPEAAGGKVLSVECDRSTGAAMYLLSRHVDLNKTPILRWRWRVRNLPPGGDSRIPGKDDQAVAVYLGAGGALARRSVGYYWETETPLNHVGHRNLGGGIVKIKHTCVRNKSTPQDTWVEEEWDVASEFKKEFGYLPETFVLTVGGNSQHTQSRTRAEIDYFEMIPREQSKFSAKSVAAD